MPTIEAMTARKQALDAEKLRLRAEARALEIAIGAAEAELKDAQAWVALPRAARNRILALSPETVAAFSDTPSTLGGERLDEWLASKLKKRKVEQIFMRTSTSYPDTPEGAGVRIRGIRGAAWCESLDVTNG